MSNSGFQVNATHSRPTSDKRNEPRLITLAPIRAKIFQHSKNEIEIIKVADISRSGISLMTSQRLPLKSVVSIDFEPPSGSASISGVVGKVHRCDELTTDTDETRFLCGLSLDMARDKSQQWDDFINEIFRHGAAIVDRRDAARLRNGLVLHHPVKQRATKFRETSSVQIVQLSLHNLDELQHLEVMAWGKDMCATREMLKSRLDYFSEGMIGARIHGKLVGYVATMMMRTDQLKSDFTWWGITDGGTIKATHDPAGDCLYGISLSVIPQAPKNVALLLLKAAGKLTVRKAMKGIFFGTRIPKYHKYHNVFSPQDYIKAKTKTGRMLDPELALYSKVDCLPIRVLPNYFEDPESLHYGVLVSWINPLYDIQRGQYPFFFDKVTIDFT